MTFRLGIFGTESLGEGPLLFRHQFCVAENTASLSVPDHFDRCEWNHFQIARELSLPQVNFLGAQSEEVGILMGWGFHGSRLLRGSIKVPLYAMSSAEDWEDWLYQLSGRWIAMVVIGEWRRVYLDPLASLRALRIIRPPQWGELVR
jgi:hypothetical protein